MGGSLVYWVLETQKEYTLVYMKNADQQNLQMDWETVKYSEIAKTLKKIRWTIKILADETL